MNLLFYLNGKYAYKSFATAFLLLFFAVCRAELESLLKLPALQPVQLYSTLFAVNFSDQLSKSLLHVTGIQSGGLKECQSLYFSHSPAIVLFHCSNVLQVCFVSNQNYSNVWVSVVLQLVQPLLDAFKTRLFSDIVDQECAECSSIVSIGNRSVALLSSGVSDLCFYVFTIQKQGLRCKFHSDCCSAVDAEFVSSEARH